MALINNSSRQGNVDDIIGKHLDGMPYMGEYDMYVRIVKDCNASPLHWYMWYDLSLPISSGNRVEIQIDFLLICEKGAIIVEVKGGNIEIIGGRYYYDLKGVMTEMKESPFDQANRYKYALISHHVINGDLIFLDYVVAFPHTSLRMTSNNRELDQGFKLWNKEAQESNASFADFCVNVISEKKHRMVRSSFMNDLSFETLKKEVDILAPTFYNKGRYSQSSLQEVLSWLHLQNLDILEGLSKNKRILIDGGPGTGKTTMAKAFIKKNKGLRGLYLCWNVFLSKRVEYDLIQEGLYNCEVKTYYRFVSQLTHRKIQANVSSLDIINILCQCMSNYSGPIYDYIIVDEAQDLIDKGLVQILDNTTSPLGKGLETGNYLIFYDLEQGYGIPLRHIEDSLRDISHFSAFFTLNENKRVAPNLQIVKYANAVLTKSESELQLFFKKMCDFDIPGIKIAIFDERKLLMRAFKEKIKESTDPENSIVLVHSSLTNNLSNSLYDSLVVKNGVVELTESNITNPVLTSLPLTTIIRYKGLEANKVLLIIPDSPVDNSFSNYLFEIYVGMTRAMMSLDILVFHIK